MTAVLRSNKYLDFRASEEHNIYIYFKVVDAKFWQLKHYLSFRLKNDDTISPWFNVYDDWQASLNFILQNYIKKIPTCITSFCKELLDICETFEGSAVRKNCEKLYNDFYQLNLDKHLEKNIVERIRLLDSTIFSERNYSDFLCKKRIGEESSSSDEKRIRHEEPELSREEDKQESQEKIENDETLNSPRVVTHPHITTPISPTPQFTQAQHNDSWITKKLDEVKNGIARYNIIFLPECNRNDQLRSKFTDDEWSGFEEFFFKKEEEIAKKVFPSLSKVETILNRYQEAIINASEDEYIDLDRIDVIYDYPNGYKFRRNWLERWIDNVYQKFLTCFHIPKNVLNDRSTSEYQYRSWFVNTLCEDIFLDSATIKMKTGEVENKHRKVQLDLSKDPGDRKSVGWYHDGILSININGNEVYVGILEVAGNAVVTDNTKFLGDQKKMLKAMRLAFHELQKTLCNDGIVDKKDEKIADSLEIFGILVDKKDFCFYTMYHRNGTYLVDEINVSFIIPDTPIQLYMVREIIERLLTFRARVEKLNTRIKEISSIRITRRPRRITTAIDATPKNKQI
ncbi:1850_t:CDS:2 [Funneliformis geosporum]|uniref:1850_t:CDS:1 n=1 Tax=Funneliformis geosporum TaxID=1117311 RepID=A0A9W4X1E3_9GLOM|nr:1850_t:CDS:2 [Funneliformis geosporum]